MLADAADIVAERQLSKKPRTFSVIARCWREGSTSSHRHARSLACAADDQAAKAGVDMYVRSPSVSTSSREAMLDTARKYKRVVR
jgi:hypothetical protein